MLVKLQILIALLGCAVAALVPDAGLAARDDPVTSPTTASTTPGQISSGQSTTSPALTTPSGDCLDGALPAGQSQCVSCSVYAFCSGGVASNTTCPAGKACLHDGDTATCLAVSMTECNVCADNQLTVCDPFDDQIVNVCVPGKAPAAYGTCTDGKTCKNGACVNGNEITTSSPGGGKTTSAACMEATGHDPSAIAIISYEPECTSGLLCIGGDLINVINCTQGQYFDPMTGACPSLPINNCDGRPDGLAPHQTNCTKFVVCQGGDQIAEFPCGEGQVLDVESDSCVSEDSGSYKCADFSRCTFEPGASGQTTEVPDQATDPGSEGGDTKPENCTADNVNQRYPVEGDCKSYSTCRKTSRSSYAYVTGKCSGTMVFNPDNTYCDLPSNVPGCAN